MTDGAGTDPGSEALGVAGHLRDDDGAAWSVLQEFVSDLEVRPAEEVGSEFILTLPM